MNGLLVLDKPSGITSRAAVDTALRWFPRKTKIGHTGTLDPLATGVLVLCLGAATRLADYIQRMVKTYRAGLLLGAFSDTDDADGTVTPVASAKAPVPEALAAAIAGFLGTIWQVPPAHSAAKVAGQRAYDLARRGDDVVLAARPVTVHGIDILRYDWPDLDLEVRCGKGTYIRALARDLGKRLGCGALVAGLRRTRVGPFTPDQGVALEADAATAHSRLLPAAMAVAELPHMVLPVDELRRLRLGQTVKGKYAIPANEVAIFDEGGNLQAIALVDPDHGLVRPVKVF